MTDDFQLFQDAEGGDPDIALITAYLARELSLVQVVAVEERLASDAAFRAKALPIIEAWAIPGSLAGHARLAAPAGGTSLTKDDIERGWQRYVAERAEVTPGAPSRPVLMRTATSNRRRPSMTRIAAGIAAVVLPVVAIAQAAMYAAKHDDAPGHAVAKRIVAPFLADAPAPAPAEPAPRQLSSPVDVPVGRELTKAPESVQRAKETAATVPAAGSGPAVAPPAPVTTRQATVNPDRAKIAGLATKHHPNVVRGDTTADYVVMVLNASGDYVWSTYGSGSVAIEVAGDPRTGAERAQFVRENRLEYNGTVAGGFGSGGGARVGGGAVTTSTRVPDSTLRQILDSTAVRVRAGAGAGVGGGVSTKTRAPDSAAVRSGTVLRVDSSQGAYRIATGTKRGGGGTGGSVARVGEWATALTPDSVRGPYRIGFGRVINGQSMLNEAPGLQQPGNNQSGVQGLLATSITAGESYMFAPGQLAPRMLRIVVLHLAPGATWNGR